MNREDGGISACRKYDFGRFEPLEALIGKPLAPLAKCDVAHMFYDVVQLRAVLVVTLGGIVTASRETQHAGKVRPQDRQG